nr:uncharacterized protein LOC126535740 [Dermacentor andersoni]
MSKKEEKELASAFSDFRREMRAEMRQIKDSLRFCSDTCDEVKAITGDIKALHQEIKALTAQNQHLKAENERLEKKVDELEQYQRSNNLEIRGVPEELDSTSVIKKIGELVGEAVTDTDIDICHRVPTARREDKNIVVRFISRTKRNTFLAKSKKKKLSSEDVGYKGTGITTIYVNGHLTRQNKQLLGAALAEKKKAGWKYVWVSSGKILARKDEQTDAIRIANKQDIAHIK